MPKISIITVNLNNCSGLRRTFDSIANQAYQEFEFVVIDGNSTDGSIDVIKSAGNLITKVLIEPDIGVYNAMNKGIKLATGDYIIFLNSGDHFYDNQSLTLAVKQLNNQDLVCFDIAVTGQGKDYIKQHPDSISLGYMLQDTLAHQAVFIKRALFESIGLYDESLKIAADWKFFLDVLLRAEASYLAIHQTITQYYLDGISATANGTFIRRAERKSILEGPYKFLLESKTNHELLQSNRFKLLKELEGSKFLQKLNSAWLRMLLFLTKGKKLKDI